MILQRNFVKDAGHGQIPSVHSHHHSAPADTAILKLWLEYPWKIASFM